MTTENQAPEGALDLIQRLRGLVCGFHEWRVENPEDGSYCISFTRDESHDPERTARDWLTDHAARFPESKYAGYVVKHHHVMTAKDKALAEAADALAAKPQACPDGTLCVDCCQPEEPCRRQAPAEGDAIASARQEGFYAGLTISPEERAQLEAAGVVPAHPQPKGAGCSNPECPCRDGDVCHYRDAADGTKAWPSPAPAPWPMEVQPDGSVTPVQPEDMSPGTPVVAPPAGDDPNAWVRFWLSSALRCTAFVWDADQRECAEGILRDAIAAPAVAHQAQVLARIAEYAENLERGGVDASAVRGLLLALNAEIDAASHVPVQGSQP